MSVMRRNGTKVNLDRTGMDSFWEEVQQYLDGEPERMWRYLAMLTLHEVGGWSLDRIGRAFNHNRGHVSRCLDRIREDLRERFGLSLDGPRLESSPEPPPPNESDPRRRRQPKEDAADRFLRRHEPRSAVSRQRSAGRPGS